MIKAGENHLFMIISTYGTAVNVSITGDNDHREEKNLFMIIITPGTAANVLAIGKNDHSGEKTSVYDNQSYRFRHRRVYSQYRQLSATLCERGRDLQL